MTGAPRDAASWHDLEATLDALLELAPGARAAALDAIARERPDEAAHLAQWLAGIERSDGFLETSSETAAPAPGLQVGAWRLERALGRGGMGEVWLAARADGAFDKRVAIKFIRADRVGLRERLVQERHVLARLEHAHVAQLLDGGVGPDGRPYLVTEFVDGLPLDRWCVERAPTLVVRLAVFRQIASAVAYAHANLIVHRDLKAANAIVDAQARAKLLDFGIATLIGDDDDAIEYAFTPECAAPEQVERGAITTRTDIYALGALLCELLTGRTPLGARGGATLAALAERIRHEAPLAPSLVPAESGGVPLQQRTRDLNAIALKALAKSPAQRYGTVEAMLADLDNAAAHRPVSARGASFAYRARCFVRRNAIATAATVALALAVAVGIAGTMWQSRVALRERDSALYLAERSDAARDFLVRLLSESRADAPLRPREMIAQAADALDSETAMRADVRAMMTNVVGELELERRDYTAAEKIFRRGAEAANASSDALAVEAMCQLGATQIALDKLDEAKHWLELGIARARKLDGSQRVTLATCLSYAGMRSRNPADLADSLRLSREAIEVIENLGGRYLSRQSALHNNYANVLAASGDARAAIDEFRRAIELLAETGRSRSVDSSTAAGNLASALADAGLLREADAEYERALRLRREVSGESIGLAQQMISHASVLVELGRASDALAELAAAETILTANSDPPGLRLAQLHLRRANAYAELGRRADAEREYDATETLYAKVLSPQSATHNNVALGRAELWMRTATNVTDLAEAEAQIEKALAHHRALPTGARPNPKIDRAFAELALLRDDAGTAETHAQAARAAFAAKLDPTAWQLAACDALSGQAAVRQRRVDEGRALLASASSRLDEALGVEHWRSRQAREWLAAASR